MGLAVILSPAWCSRSDVGQVGVVADIGLLLPQVGQSGQPVPSSEQVVGWQSKQAAGIGGFAPGRAADLGCRLRSAQRLLVARGLRGRHAWLRQALTQWSSRLQWPAAGWAAG
jgi:hypothetical protein